MPQHVSDTITTPQAAAVTLQADSVTTASETVTETGCSEATADPFTPRLCRADEAECITYSMRGVNFTTGKIPYSCGIKGLPRPMLPGYDTGVICLLLITFLFFSSNFRHYSTFVKTFAQDLWKVRNRSNNFDEHTVSETRVLTSLIMILCMSEGILLFSAIRPPAGSVTIFKSVGVCALLAALYYAFQVIAYKALGYTFTTKANATELLKGFRASQSLLGVTLVAPALIVLFNPDLTVELTAIGVTLYVLARIIFILKCFRIFYNNIFSLVYFILYLCTLEILPPIIVVTTAFYFSSIF